MYQKIVLAAATGLYSGYLRPFSGTWGTIPAWGLAFFVTGGQLLLHIAITIVLLFISVWASGEAEKTLGQDSKSIVIDEWAGMFVAVLFVPVSLTNYLIAFAAFRFFDVVKLPPAAQFERLPGGWGVTMDDIVAGVHACIVVHGYLWIMRMIGG
jgi:phosphatidylglycerophosphatase A